MKTNQLFKSMSKSAVAFLFAAAMTMGFTSCSESNESYSTSQLETISKKIANLKSKKMEEMKALEKARANRDKDYALIAGMTCPSANGLSEVSYIEKKISNIDQKICKLENTEKVLMAEYANSAGNLSYPGNGVIK